MEGLVVELKRAGQPHPTHIKCELGEGLAYKCLVLKTQIQELTVLQT